MRAHQIMARQVVTVASDASIVDAAKLMLDHHISGLPVIDSSGKLVGILSESDFLRRGEIGTQRKRPRWLQFLIGPGHAAEEFVRERGRKVCDVMTPHPVVVTEDATLEKIVSLMEKNRIRRLPVVRGGQLVGIVTRANLLTTVVSLVREVPDPTVDDEHIRTGILQAIDAADWHPFGLWVTVRNGVVHLHGDIADERMRRATIVVAENVAGVKEVHDHLCLIDRGGYRESPEDQRAAAAARKSAS